MPDNQMRTTPQSSARDRAMEFMIIAAMHHHWKDGRLRPSPRAGQAIKLYEPHPDLEIVTRHLNAFIAEYYGQEELP